MKLLFIFFLVTVGLASLSFSQNVTVNNDLIFGAVFPGIPKTISKYTAGSAAEFYVSGTAGSEITIDFALPKYMNNGGLDMQMIFNETDCSIDTSATPDQSNPLFDNLDPWHTLTYRLGSNGLTIWLGSTVVPDVYQIQGNYSASIVITVAYTGN
ncbi:MAG: DUF4402 domain-containing protein [FCB group bacterium]|nr:DUF4402 domain-containing protein [FCB group bacterium]